MYPCVFQVISVALRFLTYTVYAFPLEHKTCYMPLPAHYSYNEYTIEIPVELCRICRANVDLLQFYDGTFPRSYSKMTL